MYNKNNKVNNNINNSNYEDSILENREFQFIKNKVKYNLLIIKKKNCIIIKCKNYLVTLNNDEVCNLIELQYDSIDNSFKYLINLFNENKIIIKENIINQIIKLILILKDNKEKEIVLIYNNEPINLILLSKITKDSFCSSPIENSFTIFNSFKSDILYLIYATKNKSIKCINLIEKNLITEIKNAHNKFITNFKHYYDNNKKIDIIMSLASDENDLKLWNIVNWECILHLKNINKSGNLLSACFLKENNKIYIATSNFEIFDEPEPIKIYDDNGNLVKEITNSKENTFFLDVYFDKIKSTNYIITCNINFVKSYNYNKNITYHRYFENNNSFHNSAVVYSDNNIIKLIELCNDGYIRLWDFHSNILLKKIKVDHSGLTSMCIWDKNYAFVGCKSKGIKLIKLIEGKIQKTLKGKNNIAYTIKIINHPKYGKSLVTQGTFFEQIKFWIN